MQWRIHAFAVGAYSGQKLNNNTERVYDVMFVSMAPSMESTNWKGEQKCFSDCC